MMRRGIAPATLVGVVVLVGWLCTGVAVLDIIKFVAYDLGFVALPGIALLWALRGRRSNFLLSVALGWPLGQALEDSRVQRYRSDRRPLALPALSDRGHRPERLCDMASP